MIYYIIVDECLYVFWLLYKLYIVLYFFFFMELCVILLVNELFLVSVFKKICFFVWRFCLKYDVYVGGYIIFELKFYYYGIIMV